MVTLLPPSMPGTDSEEAWLRAVASSDAFAFLADPAQDTGVTPSAMSRAQKACQALPEKQGLAARVFTKRFRRTAIRNWRPFSK